VLACAIISSGSAHLIEQPVSGGQDDAIDLSDIIVFHDVLSMALPLWEATDGTDKIGLHTLSIRPKSILEMTLCGYILYTKKTCSTTDCELYYSCDTHVDSHMLDK
jgi:hypothetical protein